jgi:DNA ligase D-like protein (predicted ligase)
MVQRGEPPKPHPRFIEPMECHAVSQLPDATGWLYEIKLDGYRVIAVKDGKDVALYSRYGNTLTADFPHVVFALKQLRMRRFILDGEIVALDAQGRPDFQRLQNRKRDKPETVFYIFDLLHLDGVDLLEQPLLARRERLGQIAPAFSEPLRLAPVLDASLDAIIQSVKDSGLEGVVAKRAQSVYESGKRSGTWQKKRINDQQSFVIGGYIPGPNSFEALLIGEWQNGKLHYIKKLRTGFVPATRKAVLRAIEPLRIADCPFVNLPERNRKGHPLDTAAMRDCIWVKPELECEVDFVERTAGGKLRHAQFRELKSAA